jgi:hypothetical protein
MPLDRNGLDRLILRHLHRFGPEVGLGVDRIGAITNNV